MPGTTTRGFPYVQGSDNANTIDETTQLLAERCRDEYSEGTFASRPAAGTSTAGRVYYATDTGDYWRDTGSGWRLISSRAGAIAAVTAWDSDYAQFTGSPAVTNTAASIYTVGSIATPLTVGAARINVSVGGHYRVTCIGVATGSPSITVSARAGSGGGETSTDILIAASLPAAWQVSAIYFLGAGGGFAFKRSASGAQLGQVIVERLAL